MYKQTLKVRKGNTVLTTDGFTGQIVKYVSNKHIELEIGIDSYKIVTKDNIIQVLNNNLLAFFVKFTAGYGNLVGVTLNGNPIGNWALKTMEGVSEFCTQINIYNAINSISELDLLEKSCNKKFKL